MNTEIEVFAVMQEDTDNDGQPDVTIIECAFITDRDRVYVHDRGRDMGAGDDWQQITDFENDLWVFDAAADGQPELIIDFKVTDDGAVEAWLWDDQDGDGSVAHQLDPQPSVTESQLPSVKVIAHDGWWVDGDHVNFNVDVIVDGPIQASFSMLHFARYFETDGEADFRIRVRDTDHDGRPDYQWTNVWPGARSGYGIRRTEIVVSPKDDEPPIKGSIFWPFLGSTFDWDEQKLDRKDYLTDAELLLRQERSGYNKFYNISMPPIQMLWQKGALLYVSEFVASRFNDDNWFLYSNQRVVPGEVSPVDFEAPFAFYDLGADDDGYPELAIRFEQYLPRDLYAFRATNPEPLQIVRYTWDQDNNTTWDFKIGLIGRHEITEQVVVDDLRLQTVPPSELPNWITGRIWDGATFVADESEQGIWTSEGIYEWGIDGYWRNEYVTGLTSTPPLVDDLSELAMGQRAEYVADLHREPLLYLSVVDRKLHLLGAEEGVWKIDERRELRSSNLGGDYLNQWTLMVNSIPVENLFFVHDYLIYSSQSGIQITRVNQHPALLTTSPPASSEERLALKEGLDLHESDVLGWQLKDLAATFGRPDILLSGGTIGDLRMTEEGFRFTIDLKKRLAGDQAAAFGRGDLSPGSYLVTYDGSFQINPLTAPDLSLALRLSPTDALHVGESVSILVEASNAGLEDAADVQLILEAQRQGSVSIEIASQTFDVLSGAPTRSALEWEPPAVGQWEIQARLENPVGDALAEGELYTFELTQADQQPAQILILSIGGVWQTLPLLLNVIVLVVITVGVLRFTLGTAVRANPRHGERNQ